MSYRVHGRDVRTKRKLKTDERGRMPEMRTPFSRMPLKNDVAIGEKAPSPRRRGPLYDPLGYFPKGDIPKPTKKQKLKRKRMQGQINKLERKLHKLRIKMEAL